MPEANWEQLTVGQSYISLRGVEVHNLKSVDLDIPHRKLIVFCGLSGSGKTSLALDTLYAEGQRRYIETFSAYTRQFLQRLERPAAEKIAGIPPAVAVTHKTASRSSRTTVGTATEVNDYLRLLFAKIGRVVCQTCGHEVRRESPQSAAEALVQHPAEMRFLVTFQHQPNGSISATESTNFSADIQAAGFVRAIIGDGVVNLAEQPLSSAERFFVVVDRLTAGMPVNRIRESLEGAFAQGNGQAMVFVDSAEPLAINGVRRGTPYTIDGRVWQRLAFSNQMVCDECGRVIRRRSRGCTASTARWERARSAKALAT